MEHEAPLALDADVGTVGNKLVLLLFCSCRYTSSSKIQSLTDAAINYGC